MKTALDSVRFKAYNLLHEKVFSLGEKKIKKNHAAVSTFTIYSVNVLVTV